MAFSYTNDYVFFGGLDNSIKALNLRRNDIEFGLLGHTDTITGMQLSKNGNYLLSNAMDNTLKIWDVKPFVVGNDDANRLVKTFMGVAHNFEKNLLRCAWNHNDTLISAGSADRMVNVWNVETNTMVHRLGGHHGSVNETAFHP